jgi:hypothetical protein
LLFLFLYCSIKYELLIISHNSGNYNFSFIFFIISIISNIIANIFIRKEIRTNKN